VTFSHAFLFQCRRIVRRKGALIRFLLLPLLVLLLGLYLPRDTDSEVILVGVYLPEGSPAADELWEALLGRMDTQGYALRFVPALSPEQLADMVAAGVWECGYLLPRDFRERLREEEHRRMITRIESPATALAPLISEAVSAAILAVSAPDIAMSYLERSGILPMLQQSQPGYGFSEGLLDDLLDDLMQQHFHGTMLLRAEIEFLLPPAGSNSSTGIVGVGSLTLPPLIRGLIAVFLFLFSCLCSLWFIEDCRSGFYRRLSPYLKPGTLYPPYFCAAALFAGLEGFLAILLAGFFFPGFFAGFSAEALSLLLYLLYLAVLSYFFTSLFRRQEPIAAALPFLLTACLLFCPILIDFSRYIPYTGWLSALLPPTFYLRATSSAGAASDFRQLAAAAQSLGGYLPVSLLLFCIARFRRNPATYSHFS
jgi:hypothetical protein